MINSEILLELSQICRSAAENEKPPIPAMLPILKEAGYRMVRYYEVTPDEYDQPEYLILAGWLDGQISIMPEALKTVHISDSFVDTREENQLAIGRPAHDRAPEKGYSPDDIELGIAECHNIHLPILIGDSLFFEICLSKSHDNPITIDELALFSVLGKTISNYYYYRTTRRIGSVVKRYNLTMQEPVVPWNETVRRFEKAAASLVNASVASHFQFGFHQQKLQKIGMDIRAKGIKPVEQEHRETYEPGAYLTGQAATRDRYGEDKAPICRNAVNGGHRKEDQSPQYYKRYRRVLGGELSVIYLVRHGELSIDLVRLMQSRSNTIGAFTMEDSFVLRRLRARCDGVLKRAEFSHRATILREFNLQSLETVSNVKRAFQKLRQSIGGNNIAEVGAIVGRPENDHFSKVVFSGHTINKLFGAAVRAQSPTGKFVKNVQANNISFMSVEEFCDELSVSMGAGHKLGSVIALESSNRDMTIVSLIFLRRDITVHAARIMTEQLRSFLRDLGIAVTYAVNAAESHVGIENAQRLMGQIGHELFPAVVRIQETASEAILGVGDHAKEFMDVAYHDGLDNYSAIVEERVDNALMAAQRTLDIAIAMSEGENEEIHLTFEGLNLARMISEIGEKLILNDLPDLQDEGVRAQFEINDATKKLGEIVADRYMLERVLINIMRNALKYSIPRYHGLPINIKIQTNPQPDWVDIRIENWGNAIKEEDMDYIFDPFYRGHNLDKKRARRGLGLGLFIANRFAQAHKGFVKCEGSIPTLDDKERKDIEGHLVSFVIRVSRRLNKGTTIYNFQGQRV